MTKLSHYNHFYPWQAGLHIAYNARSGAVGLLDDANMTTFQSLAAKLSHNGGGTALSEKESELLKQLKYGQFVCDDNLDERASLRFRHQMDRFVTNALGLVLAPTMACNMACTYCFETNTTSRMRPQVIEAILTLVEQQAPALRSVSVCWYGGEPLLAMDIIEDLSETILDLAEERNLEFDASIISNGVLLTPSTVDKLVRWKVKTAQITLDGPARVHDRTRPLKNGQSSFSTIVENIRYAIERMGVTIRINIDRNHTPDIIEELLVELTEAGLREKVSIYFGRIEPASTVCQNIAESCYDIGDFAAVETTYFDLLFKHGFRIDKLPSPISVICMAQLVNSFLIDADGYHYRCFNHVGDREKAVGSILEPIDYQHPNFMRLFEFDPFTSTECASCDVLPLCMGGCPARRIDQHQAGQPACESWKHNLQPMLEIIAKSKQQEYQRQAAAAAKE